MHLRFRPFDSRFKRDGGPQLQTSGCTRRPGHMQQPSRTGWKCLSTGPCCSRLLSPGSPGQGCTRQDLALGRLDSAPWPRRDGLHPSEGISTFASALPVQDKVWQAGLWQRGLPGFLTD